MDWQAIYTGPLYWVLVIIAIILMIIAFKGTSHNKQSKKKGHTHA